MVPSTQTAVYGPELNAPLFSRQKTKAVCDPPAVKVCVLDTMVPITDIAPTSTKSRNKLQDLIPEAELTFAESVTATLARAFAGETVPIDGPAATTGNADVANDVATTAITESEVKKRARDVRIRILESRKAFGVVIYDYGLGHFWAGRWIV